MGRQANTGTLPPLPTEEFGNNEQEQNSEAQERIEETESTEPAAIAGEQSPENPKNDATADSTLEGADTPQLQEDEQDTNTDTPVAGTDDAGTLSSDSDESDSDSNDDEELEQSGPKTHTTKQGETFGDVVERFGIDHITLAKLNPDVNPHSVLAGTKLKLKA